MCLIPVLPMAPARWPRRDFYRVGEGADDHLKALESWVRGGRVHPYGRSSFEEYGDAVFGQEGEVEFESRLAVYSGLSWRLRAVRRGDLTGKDAVFCSGYSHPGDAAYTALSLIEEHDREEFEARLVVGVA